jgi:diaminopimelate epimerase
MKADFYKYHALGNDYLVIDPSIFPFNPSPENVRKICDRNFGVGSDGILFGPVQTSGGILLQIFNPDGSEAEKSGNGIRIFSRYIFEKKYVNNKNFTILTKGGKVEVSILKDDASLIKVAMGKVTFTSSKIPVNGEEREVVNENLQILEENFKVTCLSIGNPHCVIPLEEISKEKAYLLGPEIENHAMFPNRINMQLVQVLDRFSIKIEIWERGAGYTLASGSSSCAAASAVYKLGLVDNHIDVHMPGGMIHIDILPDGMVMMTGAVESVYSGIFSDDIKACLTD